jgi:hypothetical protein
MARAGEDFATFVRARWAELTDELVDEGAADDLDDGLTRAQAQQAVVRGLADCQAGWRRVLAEESPEVVVREAIASHRSTVLPDEPVSDPLAAIAGIRAERRRRTFRLVAVSGLAAAVTAAVVLLWPHQAPEPQPVHRAEANALPVAWWYGGELHLDTVVVDVVGVTAVARIGNEVWVRTAKETLAVDPASGEVSKAPTTLGDVPSSAGRPVPHPELIPPTQVIRSWATTPAGNYLYAVQHRANEHAADESIRLSTSGPWLILQCSLRGHPGFSPCEVVTQLPADSAQPPIFEQS